MSSLSSFFSSSIGRKLIMGLTGLFLVSFLLVHLSGNLLLFSDDGGVAFNKYTKFMTTNSVIRVMEWVLFAGFIIHIVYAATLTTSNKKARPEDYAYSQSKSGSSSWFSRNMGLSGSIVLVFLLIHLTMFWGKYQFMGSDTKVNLETIYEESWKLKEEVTLSNGDVLPANSYIEYEAFSSFSATDVERQTSAISMTEVVKASFGQWYIVLFYVIAMVLLSFHLNHGFQSGFRTLGLVHSKYTPLITKLGTGFAIVVPLIFGLMPIWYFFAY